MSGSDDTVAARRNRRRRGRPAVIFGVLLAVVATVTVWAVTRDTAAVERATTQSPSAITAAGSASPGSTPAATPDMGTPNSALDNIEAPSEVVTAVVDSPLGNIDGVSVRAVTTAWQSQFRQPLTVNAENHLQAIIVKGYQPAGGALHLVVVGAKAKDDHAQAVRCIVEYGRKTVDRKLLNAVVGDCLRPALEGSEQQAIAQWLGRQNYRLHGQAQQITMPRFDVVLDARKDAMRIGIVGRP